MMSRLFKLYLERLKTHPLSTNATTSGLLMVIGDVIAQKIEAREQATETAQQQKQEEELRVIETFHHSVKVQRRVSLRRYLSQDPNGKVGEYSKMSSHSDEELKAKETIERVMKEIQNIDFVRSATMAGFGALVATPGYMILWRWADRMFPQKTALTVFYKVVLSALYSVPNNFMFFLYGTSVHYTIEHLGDYIRKTKGMDVDGQELQPLPPYDIKQMIYNCRKKLDAEFQNTIFNSLKVWPLANGINFALMPSHMRPVFMNCISVCWNCYMSIVQHRDIIVEENIEREHINIRMMK
jgi:hypothetical protein